ncbi:hypothetical protein SMICM17S_00423 [Streptomyces microflavus]
MLKLGVVPAPPAGESMWHNLAVGWREFWSRSWLWGVIVIWMFYAVLAWGPQLSLAAGVIVPEHGARAFGLVNAALGAGTIIGGLLAIRYKPERPLAAGAVAMMAYPIARAHQRPLTDPPVGPGRPARSRAAGEPSSDRLHARLLDGEDPGELPSAPLLRQGDQRFGVHGRTAQAQQPVADGGRGLHVDSDVAVPADGRGDPAGGVREAHAQALAGRQVRPAARARGDRPVPRSSPISRSRARSRVREAAYSTARHGGSRETAARSLAATGSASSTSLFRPTR